MRKLPNCFPRFYCKECDLFDDHWEDCGKDDEEPQACSADSSEFQSLGAKHEEASELKLAGLAAWLPKVSLFETECTCPTLLNGHHPECPREKK